MTIFYISILLIGLSLIAPLARNDFKELNDSGNFNYIEENKETEGNNTYGLPESYCQSTAARSGQYIEKLTLNWSKKIGSEEVILCNSMDTTSDGGFILVGEVSYHPDPNDMYLVKVLYIELIK